MIEYRMTHTDCCGVKKDAGFAGKGENGYEVQGDLLQVAFQCFTRIIG